MFPDDAITLRTQRRSTALRARLALEGLESRLVPYSVTGNAWSHPELVTISFVPDGTNLGGVSSNLFATFNAKWSTAAWQNQILRAAQVWGQRSNLNFTVVSDSGAPIGSGNFAQGDPTMGDIRVGGYNFGSATLATGYMPPPANNYSIAGDIAFNTGQVWAIGATYDLFTVAAHEFGHALGLSHGTDATAAMYGSYNTKKTDLSGDDISGIRAVYSARSQDRYDTGSANASFGAATDITPLIDSSSNTALVSNLNITTTSDIDFYTFTAPAGTSNSFTIKVQSKGLSLLAPALTIYAADQSTVLGSISGMDRTGNALALTVTNVTAGKRFYVKIAAADTSAFGTGAYALTLNFGTGASPTVTSPNTQTAAASTPQSGGGQANDTFLPNNVVTQVALGAVDTVTTLGSSENLVPGLTPHPPGCICPFCHNGGYAPAQADANPVTPVVAHAGNPTESTSAVRPAGTNPFRGATLDWEAISPVGTNGPVRSVTLTAPPSPSLAGNTLATPAPASLDPACSTLINPAQSGAGTVSGIGERISPTTDGPEVSGGFIVDPNNPGLLPAAGPALPMPTPDDGESAYLSSHLHVSSILELGAGGTTSDNAADRDAVWSLPVGMAALLGGTALHRFDWESRKKRSAFGAPVGSERRQAARYPCWLNSACRPLGGPILERAEAIASNLSTGGVRLLLQRPFEEGILLAVELRNVWSGLERLVLVRVKHTAEESRGRWVVGCTFDRGLSEEEVRTLLIG